MPWLISGKLFRLSYSRVLSISVRNHKSPFPLQRSCTFALRERKALLRIRENIPQALIVSKVSLRLAGVTARLLRRFV